MLWRIDLSDVKAGLPAKHGVIKYASSMHETLKGSSLTADQRCLLHFFKAADVTPSRRIPKSALSSPTPSDKSHLLENAFRYWGLAFPFIEMMLHFFFLGQISALMWLP